MTYLDTHVVVWLHAGTTQHLSAAAREQIESDGLLVSPAVVLELQYLTEIRRLKAGARKIMEDLSRDIGLGVCELPFAKVVEQALGEDWVRDPFDRLIVAQAKVNSAPLVTKDEHIRRIYRQAVW